MQLLCYQPSTLHYQLFQKKTNRPCRSVPHSRRRHERRLNFSFLSALNHSQTRRPPAAIGSSPTASRAAAKIIQSRNLLKIGVSGRDKDALDNARQMSFVPNKATRFLPPRERDTRKAPGSFACAPSICFSNVVFIRSLPPELSAAPPTACPVLQLPASVLSCTKPAMAAEPRGPGSIPCCEPQGMVVNA
jgi:hypothetical protein